MKAELFDDNLKAAIISAETTLGVLFAQINVLEFQDSITTNTAAELRHNINKVYDLTLFLRKAMNGN